ncbi:MAG: ATP synthase F1 subunit gamma [Bacteroidota bacterium]|nr:MAG: ATP synthase F1 subunit gamma [Bacteroidota bacterium]
MANLKEIRTRINSVKTTRQITSAMKMVSAAKLRKSQDAIIQMRPYAHKLQQILSDLAENVESETVSAYQIQQPLKKILFIVITSNKGLCGSFNANIAKQAINEINTLYSELWNEGAVDILAIGKKGAEMLTAKGYKPKENKHHIFDNLTFEQTRIVSEEIVSKYLKGEYNLVKLFYNQFRNAATQDVTAEQYLPLPQIDQPHWEKEHHDYILEPGKEEIIASLIPKSLKVTFYKALIESFASEQGARMTAMHKATDNASDLIRDLQLEYNKARQASITNEILEIVGGAEALKG